MTNLDARPDADQIMTIVDAGGDYDLIYRAPDVPVFSRHTIYQVFHVDDRERTAYVILHGIDGTTTYFTRPALLEVIDGRRRPWDGDLDEDLEEV